MTKYRITKHHNTYYIQKRYFFVFWVYLSVRYNIYSWNDLITSPFKTSSLEEANDVLKTAIELDNAKTKVVKEI